MATLKEFEEALRQHGMANALAILETLKKRDREKRSIAPARRVVGRKMTAELARSILELHASTGMTQQEIAFKLGVNQGRVNEVIKRGKWLSADPSAPEALSRDKAMHRLDVRAKARRAAPVTPPAASHPRPAVTPTRLLAGDAARPPIGSTHVVRRTEVREMPAAVQPPSKPDSSPRSTRLPLRRPAVATSPIVSAQLAFLDL